MSLHNIFPQSQYQAISRDTANWVSKAWKASLNHDELINLENFKLAPEVPHADDQEGIRKFREESARRLIMSQNIMKQMMLAKVKSKTGVDLTDISKHSQEDLNKASGVFSSLGYNFYDLRAPVAMLFPVNVPLRNTIKRVGRVNDGYGTAAHWMANRNPGILYSGVSEGQRGGVATPDQNSYTATYKELGIERAVSFTAEFAGEGFADNLADEHQRGLFEFWLQEEGMILGGNSGTASGNNGFALGTCPTPSTAVAATSTYVAGGQSMLPYTTAFTTSNWVSVACVALTALGNPTNSQYGYQATPTIAGGLTPVFTRNNADGSTDTIYGGMSAISVISNVTQLTTGNLVIKATLPAASLPMKGVFGYAWFVDTETSNTGSLGAATLAGITTTPYAYIRGTATGTQLGTAANLNADHSFNKLDFDGLLTYASTTSGAYWNDLSANVITAGASNNSLTSGKDGTVNEVETALQTIFNNYQTGVDEIWGSPDAVLALHKAIRYSGTNASGYQFIIAPDRINNITGGFVVSGYQSRFQTNSPTGANVIPIRMHPMMPAGTLYFRVNQNPYPHSRIPYMEGMLVQRDYYSIEWPLTTRQWTFGTYAHEVLQHYAPWIPGVLTGVGAFVGN